MRTWYGLRVQSSAQDEEILLAWIWSLEPLGVEEVSTGVWVLYAERPWPPDLNSSLPPAVAVQTEAVPFEMEDQDWSAAWKAAWKPVTVGETLLVVPAWWNEPVDQTRNQVRIDPGRAFGTGTHESTILAWESLEAILLDEFPAGLLVDVGTGTGVLSLGALLLRQDLRAVGTERDRQAMTSLAANLDLNEQASRFQVVLAEAVPLANEAADLGVVNVTAAEHDVVRREVVRVLAPGGHLVVSGLLDVQEAQQIEIWNSCGFRVLSRRVRGEWVSLTLVASKK